jgi:Zn-dependent M16 (insulinase) family peptidase
MNELNVNLTPKSCSEVNTSENVNLTRKLLPKLTFHLSKQARQILTHYAKDFNRQYQQTELITAIYGKVTPSKKASVSRTIRTLKKAGLIGESKAHYSNTFSCWIVHRIRFYITEKGEQFVKENLREVKS